MIQKFVTIFCDGYDGERCAQKLDTGIATVAKARKHAVHEHGWMMRDGVDRCPECAKKYNDWVLDEHRRAFEKRDDYVRSRIE